MNKKKALIAIGGTGGHVFPGYNLAKHLIKQDYEIDILSDKRGFKYLKNFENLKIYLLPSYPLNTKNIFTTILNFTLIFYSIFRSLIFLIFNRPSIIFGMGGYASFPICIAASILRVKFIIYENNLVIGKANKYLLPYAKKILVSYNSLEGVLEKYKYKVVEIGNIIKKEIIHSQITKNPHSRTINILVLGGSQAAKIFAEVLPNIFKECSDLGVSIKIYQHCLPTQNEQLKEFYEKNKIDFETFNFTNNLNEFFSKVNLAITRSGSSILAELTNAKIPFISVPLPSSAENHQLKNAIFYQNKKFAFLIEEKDLNDKLLKLITKINSNRAILKEIIKNQSQYSDKNVYNNINLVLKDLNDEKN